MVRQSFNLPPKIDDASQRIRLIMFWVLGGDRPSYIPYNRLQKGWLKIRQATTSVFVSSFRQ